jgi:hypothetical protein
LTDPMTPMGAAGNNQGQFAGGKRIDDQLPQLPNKSLFD